MAEITDTLEAYCRNPDGKTFNGLKLMQWLHHATTGKVMTDAECQALWDEAKKRAEERRANG